MFLKRLGLWVKTRKQIIDIINSINTTLISEQITKELQALDHDSVYVFASEKFSKYEIDRFNQTYINKSGKSKQKLPTLILFKGDIRRITDEKLVDTINRKLSRPMRH